MAKGYGMKYIPPYLIVIGSSVIVSLVTVYAARLGILYPDWITVVQGAAVGAAFAAGAWLHALAAG